MKHTASIVICTRNREESLARCLSSLSTTLDSAPATEVIVVDNASTDGTKDTALRYESCLPGLRFIHEGRLGLPFARNTGWKAAAGDIVCYIDDDVVVERGWLENLLAAYDIYWDGSSPIVVGGRVVPEFINCNHYPDWLDDKYKPYLTQLDLGPSCRWLHDHESLVGASFTVPRNILDRIGGFNESMPAYGNDERWVEQQVNKNGGRLLYCGTSVVHHAVTRDRLTLKWFMRRMYLEGRCTKRMNLLERSLTASERIAGPCKKIVKILLFSVTVSAFLCLGNRRRAFDYACRCSCAVGALVELSMTRATT